MPLRDGKEGFMVREAVHRVLVFIPVQEGREWQEGAGSRLHSTRGVAEIACVCRQTSVRVLA